LYAGIPDGVFCGAPFRVRVYPGSLVLVLDYFHP
jgi:hypothetical protein